MTAPQVTRRSWFKRVCALLVPVAPAAAAPALPFYGTLTSDHPMAPNIEVHDAAGRKLELVRAVNVEEGWVDQYIKSGNSIMTLLTTDEAKRIPNIRHVSCAGMSATIPVQRTYGKFTIHRRPTTPTVRLK